MPPYPLASSTKILWEMAPVSPSSAKPFTQPFVSLLLALAKARRYLGDVELEFETATSDDQYEDAGVG